MTTGRDVQARLRFDRGVHHVPLASAKAGREMFHDDTCAAPMTSRVDAARRDDATVFLARHVLRA